MSVIEKQPEPDATWEFRLPPQFCGQLTYEQRLASRLGLSEIEAERLRPWLGAPDFTDAIQEAGKDDSELFLAMSVLADWRDHEERGRPPIRLKEASSWGTFRDTLVEEVSIGRVHSFAKERRGTDLRRRFDKALTRVAEHDAETALTRAMSHVGRIVSKHRQKPLDESAPTSKLDRLTLVAPNAVGDGDYFISFGDAQEKAERTKFRYATLWGPFIPEPVWRLMLGTVEFLQSREAKTGRTPVSASIISAESAKRLYAKALCLRNLAVAVRWVARIALGVIRFDADGWVRSERSGLDGDIALNFTNIDEDALCEWIAEAIVAATRDSEIHQ